LFSKLGFGHETNPVKSKIVDYYTEFNYEWVNEKIIIPVAIEGTTYRFILDTGATTLISSELSLKINAVLKSSTLITDASNKEMRLNSTEIPNISIGGIEFKNTSALINKDDSNIVFNCFKIDGLIGSNVFQNSIVQILPKEKRIIITNNRKRLDLSKKNASKILLDNSGKPYVLIKINGNTQAKGYVLLDTGMKGFFDLSNNNFKIYQKKNIFNVSHESSGSIGGGLFGAADKTGYYKIVVPEIYINSVSFKNVTTETTNGKSSRVGTELLKFGSIAIDFINKKFYFDSLEKSNDLTEETLGFTPTLINNKLVVGLVWNKSLQSLMNAGDEILEINGIDFVNYDPCDLVAKKNIFSESKQFIMKLKDEAGNISTVTLEKATIKKH
jgi:hypothetical protein